MKKTNTSFSSLSMRLIAFAIMFVSINSCKKINEDDPLKQPSVESFAVVRVVKSIRSFGAVGDGKTDNYKAFVSAAAYASSHPNTTINFPAGTYYIAKYRKIQNDPIDHIYWKNCKGLKIIGEAGTKVSVNGKFFRPLDYTSAGANRSYTSGLSPFWFDNCDDVEIRNFEITGNVQNTTRNPGVNAANPSVTESNNNLLRFTKCSNVVIDSMFLHHAESDGILISGQKVNGVYINSSNFTVTNVRCFNNGRQGMSIGGLDNGYFKNCEFKLSGFTEGAYGYNDPAGGVDIEPYITTTSKFQTGIKFESCTFENNLGGQFMCTAPTTTENVTLLKCSFIAGIEVPSLQQGVTVLAKNVLIDQCTMKLGSRKLKITNANKPGSSVKVTNSVIQASANCIWAPSPDLTATTLISNNKFTLTKSVLTTTFLTLQTKGLQFLNNTVYIPAAAIKSRPTAAHILVQNAIISKGNRFYSNDPAVKPTVSYTGTRTVADLN